MASEHEFQEGLGERSNGLSGSEYWNAKGSLRRNVGLDKPSGDGEETPLLLASGHGDASGDTANRQPDWEGHADYDGLPWWKTPAMYWLLPPFFLFAMAVGGIMVPKLNLILSLVCRSYFAEQHSLNPSFMFAPVVLGQENPQCRIPEVQALATKFTLYMTIIAGILSAIASPKLGALSDRYGRIKVLTLTSFGGLLGELITIAAGKYPDVVDYRWLLLGQVFDGMCGSFTAGMAITHAYAADCTAPQNRAVAFGYFHACLFSGIAVGPLIAALLVRETGSIISPFYLALGIHTFFICFILIAVPESLTKKRQQLARDKYKAELRDVHADGTMAPHSNQAFDDPSYIIFLRQINILEPLKVLYPTGPGTSSRLRWNLILLSAVDTIIFGVAMGSMTVVVYYTGYQFGWDTARISVYTSVVNSFRVSALIIVLPILNYIFRTRVANRYRRESGVELVTPNSGSDNFELYLVRIAICFEIAGFAGFAAARVDGLFVLAGILAACGGVGSPTLQSSLTKHVPHEKVGQLLGATGLLHSLARIVCPLVFNLIYAGTVKTFPQAVFVVLSACFGFAFLCSWFIRPHVYLEDLTTAPLPASLFTNEADDALLEDEVTYSFN